MPYTYFTGHNFRILLIKYGKSAYLCDNAVKFFFSMRLFINIEQVRVDMYRILCDFGSCLLNLCRDFLGGGLECSFRATTRGGGEKAVL